MKQRYISLIITRHAQQRMAQRNISLSDVLYVLQHGKCFHCSGTMQVHLRKTDLPARDRKLKQLSRLEGVTVVLSRGNSSVLTVWRNRQHGVHHIRKKRLYQW